MPGFASKRQMRMMMAILHEGNKRKTKRGDSGPPRSVVERYESSGKGDDLPEEKGKSGPEHGGSWDHKKDKKEKKHKKLHKSKQSGVGVVVALSDGSILMGRQKESGEWSLPGGHVESGESSEQAAIRELEEETGLKLKTSLKQISESDEDCHFYVTLKDKPVVKDSEEMQDVAFYPLGSIDLKILRPCSAKTLKLYSGKVLSKSKKLTDMVNYELLEKNIVRSEVGSDVVHELTHGDALKLVGNGMFRILRDLVKEMKSDTIADKKIGPYTIHVRKHANDVYSGRVDDGLKTIYQFVNRSLPSLTGELMSVFEWYLPEDFKEEDLADDEKLSDDVIEDGIKKLVDNYKSKNLADIYEEMENIREEIRSGNAIDLQQAEHKIMSLFDKLENTLRDTQEKHNGLCRQVGDDLDEVENKLLELQGKIDEMSKKPSKVEAFSTERTNPNKIFNEFYSYLPKPRVVIEPSGRIIIDFSSEWTSEEKSNFLSDMKAKIIKRK